jgi:diguanylate cyclase (GGDEF)-like protein/PAS domain S-box-containing protein
MKATVRPQQDNPEGSARIRAELERRSKITPAMLHSIDAEGRLISVSDAWLAKLGYAREEVIGRRSSEFLTPQSREYAVKEVLPEFFRCGHCENVEYQMVCKDGRVIDVLLSAVLDRDPSGRGPVSVAVITDVTAPKAAEQRLRQSEARYRLLAENSTDMVFQVGRDLLRRYVSPACREIFGREPEELIGSQPFGMIHPDDVGRVVLTYQSLFEGRAERLSVINRGRHRDGRWIWVEARFRALKDPLTGEVTSVVGTLRDISARKAIEEQLAAANSKLRALAGQDGLTGLANRRAFDAAMAQACRQAQRRKTSLALLMIDVDWFKAFNDRFGHLAGDECLRRIAQEITAIARRPGDVASRYGGEEFVVLLPEMDEAAAAALAERLREAVLTLGIAHPASAVAIVTVSAGVASAAPGEAAFGPKRLLQAADEALYRAKEGGRNMVALASGPAAATPAEKAAG